MKKGDLLASLFLWCMVFGCFFHFRCPDRNNIRDLFTFRNCPQGPVLSKWSDDFIYEVGQKECRWTSGAIAVIENIAEPIVADHWTKNSLFFCHEWRGIHKVKPRWCIAWCLAICLKQAMDVIKAPTSTSWWTLLLLDSLLSYITRHDIQKVELNFTKNLVRKCY